VGSGSALTAAGQELVIINVLHHIVRHGAVGGPLAARDGQQALVGHLDGVLARDTAAARASSLGHHEHRTMSFDFRRKKAPTGPYRIVLWTLVAILAGLYYFQHSPWHVQSDAKLAEPIEIVREARIALQTPEPQDQICGVGTLTLLDLATSKLLANADRQADAGVFSRDVIDLAMMNLTLPKLRNALEKASEAYGSAITRDLAKAIDRLQEKPEWMERCMKAMDMHMPKALLWKKIRNLRCVLPEVS